MEGQRAEILEEMEGTLFKRKMPSRKVPEIFGLMGFWRLWRLGSLWAHVQRHVIFRGPWINTQRLTGFGCPNVWGGT